MHNTSWNDDEHVALRGLSLLAKVIYLLVFRRRMDYATGIAGGGRCKISYQTIVDEAGFVPDFGCNGERWMPTKQKVRSAIAALERAGMLRDAGSSKREGYKKRLILATTDQSVQKGNNAGTTQEQRTVSNAGNNACNSSEDNELGETSNAGNNEGGTHAALQGTTHLRYPVYPEEQESASALLFGSPPAAVESNVTRLSESKAVKTRTQRAAAVRVVAFLNERTGSRYQSVESTLKPIMARFQEGYTEQQFRQVIARKVREWGSDERMRQYLRPKTLFCATNFANYAGELGSPEVLKRDERR